MKNTRIMKFLGEDEWNRPVYKCVETNVLWKDINCGDNDPALYSCGNQLEGDPCSPIKSDLKINFIDMPEKQTREEKFNYMMLGRLRSDCDYYLNYGNRNKKCLHNLDEKEHIEHMKQLHNSFTEGKKPMWLSYDKILEYEQSMIKI